MPTAHGRGGELSAINSDVGRAEALLTTGALQSAIFNSANFSSIATDAKGVIQIFNVGAERMLGDYLCRPGPFTGRSDDQPALLLDLKLPKVDGLEELRQIKADTALEVIPVVMTTSSRKEQDVVRSYELGGNAYVVKPLKFLDFVDAVAQVSGFWAVLNEVPERLRRSEP